MHRDQSTILVVDDDLVTRDALVRALRAARFRTMEAASGAEALECAGYVTAAVLDVHLPDMVSWNVCRGFRAIEATATLPIVHVTSGPADDDDRALSRRCGADGYFILPSESDLLIVALDSLIARGRDA